MSVAVAEEMRSALDAVFGEYRVPVPSSAIPWRLEDEGEHWSVTTDQGAWQVPSGVHGFGLLERRLADRMALDSGASFIVHAGSVLMPAGAVLLAGPSGSGKSSVTMALADRGHAVHSDDAALLDVAGGVLMVRAFPRLLKVHDGARTRIGLPPTLDRLNGMFREVAYVHPAQLGVSWAGPAPVVAVAHLTRRPGLVTHQDLTPTEALRALMTLRLHPDDPAEMFTALAGPSEGLRSFRVGFARCDEAAASIEALVSGLDDAP